MKKAKVFALFIFALSLILFPSVANAKTLTVKTAIDLSGCKSWYPYQVYVPCDVTVAYTRPGITGIITKTCVTSVGGGACSLTIEDDATVTSGKATSKDVAWDMCSGTGGILPNSPSILWINLKPTKLYPVQLKTKDASGNPINVAGVLKVIWINKDGSLTPAFERYSLQSGNKLGVLFFGTSNPNASRPRVTGKRTNGTYGTAPGWTVDRASGFFVIPGNTFVP